MMKEIKGINTNKNGPKILAIILSIK